MLREPYVSMYSADTRVCVWGCMGACMYEKCRGIDVYI